jgi:integrase/recombinase XerD
MERGEEKMQWQITPDKYLSQTEIVMLLDRLQELSKTGKQIYIKGFMLCDLLLHTGLRVGETQALLHQDFYLDTDEPRLHVRNGKGNRERWIALGDKGLREHIKQYTAWKPSILQSIQPNCHFFMSKCDQKYSISGLQGLAKVCFRTVGLEHHSIHHLRHSFAVHHYQRNLDLRGLQLLLGHSSPVTTSNQYTHRPFSELLAGTTNLYERR